MWWWRRKRYCEICSKEIEPQAARVEVAGVPYHFACYPPARAPHVTRYLRTGKNVYRPEFLTVEWQDAILDTTVLRRRAERIDDALKDPRNIRRGQLALVQLRRRRPVILRPHHPRWLSRPAAR